MSQQRQRGNASGGNLRGRCYAVLGAAIRLPAGEEGTKKTIELAHELLPSATTIGKLINPTFVDAEPEVTEVDAAARSLGLTVSYLHVRPARAS
jgi:hypothetical protein